MATTIMTTSFIGFESQETINARQKIKEIFQPEGFQIHEEVCLPNVTNNMGELIIPPYRADMILVRGSIIFIIEFDPQTGKKRKRKGHGTRIKIIKDKWRNKNILRDVDVKTVRLIPSDILKQSEKEILIEILWQILDQDQDEEEQQEK